MTDSLPDEALELAAQPPAILFLWRGDAHHGADPRLAAFVGQERTHEALTVDPVGLSAPSAPRDRYRGGVNDVTLDTLLLERPVQPEAVQACLLDNDQRKELT